MKNFPFLSVSGRLPISLFFLIAFSLLFVSCEKQDLEESMSTDLNASAAINEAKANPAPAPGDEPIAAIAIGQGFNELVAALTYVDETLDAGLVNLFLNGTDQYTVFAPTDEAFQELYTALEVENINDLEPELVLSVLLYHVTDGRRAANSVVPKKNYRTIETLLGQTFKVNSQGTIMAANSSASITSANISASNGIIHVIDAVLLPE